MQYHQVHLKLNLSAKGSLANQARVYFSTISCAYNCSVQNLVRNKHNEVILNAALGALEEIDVTKVTMANIAARTNLSRTAIYQYFSSVSDIFAELVINDMADLVNQLESHMRKIEDPTEQIRVWTHYSLAHLSTGEHAIIRRLSEIKIAPEKRGIIRALHGQFKDSLLMPIKNLEIDNAEATSAYVMSVINSAANRIDMGMDFAYEASAAEKFIMAAIKQNEAD